MIKLVIVDFDDTLCLTEQACLKLENKVAEKMGFPHISKEAHIKNWGKPLYEAIAERIPGIDQDTFIANIDAMAPEMVKNGEIDIVTDINLETLDELKKFDIKTAILTSRTFIEVKHLLDKNHPLSERIDKFYHKDNSGHVKPNPKVFDKALAHFNVTPDEAVYIGDSLDDAKAAKGAGLHFIALLESKIRTRDYFKTEQVDFFAEKFGDILDYIKT